MPKFIPFEFPTSSNGEWIVGLDDAGVLRSRSVQLGLSQQEVSKKAEIPLAMYQELESGELDIADCDLKTGLAICAVLMLEPNTLVGIRAETFDKS